MSKRFNDYGLILKANMANAENHSYPLEGFTRSSREMPGASYEEARRLDAEGAAAQESLVGLIRNIMNDQNADTKDIPTSKLRLAGLIRKTIVGKRSARPKSQPKSHPKSESKQRDTTMISKGVSSFWGMLWRILKPGVSKVASYRPTPKHLGFAALAVVVFLRPWLIPVTILVLAILAVIIWLSLGPDRVSEIVYGLWQRLQARNPERAGKIKDRYQSTVARINRILSRVPGKRVRRVRLRDYADEEQPETEANLPDPFDRLAAEARQDRKEG